jgi:hypothetical protein
METTTISNNVEVLIEKAGDYLETRFDLLKLRAADRSADIISSFASKLIVLLVMSVFFIILNIGIAIYVGELTGKLYYGFFIVAGFYFIAGLIFYQMRHRWLKNPFADKLVQKMLK